MSLRAKTRERLLTHLNGLELQDKWKILVLDATTFPLVSNLFETYELMELKFTLTVMIADAIPLPILPAVYFLHPSSLNILMQSWEHQKPYAAAHVFFNDFLTSIQKQNLLLSPLSNRLQNFCEVPLGYCAIEEKVFLCNADPIASICYTLKERPWIRYHPAHKDLAEMLQEKTADLPESEEPLLLLLVDRNIDQISPLVHEFTYEAMVYDLLEIKDNIYHYTFVNGKGEKIPVQAKLDHNDPLWEELRYQHVAEVQEILPAKIREFMAANITIQLRQKQQVTVQEIGAILKDLPQYQKKLQNFSTHVNLLDQIMKIFKEKNLEELALLEQDLVCDVESNKKVLQKRLKKMLEETEDPERLENLAKLKSNWPQKNSGRYQLSRYQTYISYLLETLDFSGFQGPELPKVAVSLKKKYVKWVSAEQNHVPKVTVQKFGYRLVIFLNDFITRSEMRDVAIIDGVTIYLGAPKIFEP